MCKLSYYNGASGSRLTTLTDKPKQASGCCHSLFADTQTLQSRTHVVLSVEARLFGINRSTLRVVARMTTEVRWESRNRFEGFCAAHSVFARVVDLAGRCLFDRLGDRVASASQPL